MNDVLGDANLFQQQDDDVSEIELPPFVTVGRTAWKRMVIIVPTLAIVGQTNEPIIAALV